MANEHLGDAQGSMLDKLSQLDGTFNTNPGFGFMGMLEKQDQDARAAVTSTSQPTAVSEIAPEKLTDVLEPFQSSLRSLKEENANQFSALRSELSSLRTPPVQAITTTDASNPPDPISREIGDLRQEVQRTKLDTAWQHAAAVLQEKKRQHPDFDYSVSDLQNMWRGSVGNNADTARGIDWDAYFDSEYAKKALPELQKRLDALEAEKASMSNAPRGTLADISGVPNANRQTVPMRTQNDDGVDEEVYREATKNMSKGTFRGFGRALYDAQTRKSLLTAR